MRSLVVFFLLCASVTGLHAQSSITGIVNDTLNHQQLGNTTVALLNATDSVLVKFTRTKSDGRFRLQALSPGNYLVMISMPSYADYVDKVTVEDNKELDMGTVSLTLKSRLLEEVFVKQTIAAVRLKGDTIEFKADSFRVREGASVEEMLRKLPGLQVDKDGNVTAHGTRVEKVLVDGEEFFGDDPTMATKNLQASAIDKVQVFDKKSDQAAFTGIDDGTKTKTINLTLKEDKKKGYFGKLELAGGLENRWNNVGMLNAFKAKRKLSIYGIMSSTGKTGLDWGEREKFGGSSGMNYDSDGGYFYSTGGSDEFDNYGAFNGQGIPTSWSAGTHYSNKFNSDKQSINGSYRYNKLNTEGGGNTVSQSILPNSLFYNREQREIFTTKQRHAINGTYEWQIDSFTSLKLVANGQRGTSNSLSTFNSETNNEAGSLANMSNRFTSALGTNGSINSNLLLRKRFRKAGRTISLTIDQQIRETKTDGNLFSINRFFDEASGSQVRIDTVDQKKVNEIINQGYFGRVAYTEPIIKNVFVEIGGGIRISNSESKRLSYDESFNGKYDVLNDTFSNHFDFNVVTSSGGISWRYNGKKLTASGGGDIAFADFRQKDLLKDTMYQYAFRNFFPKANAAYKFNANSRVNISYNGNTRQPTIEQIQPIRDNTNPLNVAIGNPNLRQEFRHNFGFNFHMYKVLKQRGFHTYGSYNFVSNAISMSETTAVAGDSIGKRTFQYINVNGNYNGYAGAGFHMKIKKLDLNTNLGLNVNVSRYNTIINGLPNVTNNNSYGFNFALYKHKDKKYNVSYDGNFRYNTSTSSINKLIETNYYTQAHELNFTIHLPGKFEINSQFQINLRQRTTVFDQNNNVFLWNGYFGRKLFKNDKGLLKLQAYDILDQNRGFNRYINSAVIREETHQTLRRYFLLSFIWNFTKNPGEMR
jgi:hypothetical protein